MTQLTAKALLLATTAGLLTACGGSNNWISNGSVSTYTQNQDVYGKVSVDIGTSGLLFPTLQVPVYNNGAPIGQLSLLSGLGSSNSQLAVDINLSQIARLPRLGNAPTLPNGMPIPVAGVDPQNLLVLMAGSNQTRVYVDFNSQTKSGLLGVAIPFRQFDGLGQATGGLLNIMPSFKLPNGLTGTAGLFTGAGPGQSGFALFVDISSIANTVSASNSMSTNKGLSVQSVRAASTPRQLQFLNVSRGSTMQQMRAYSTIQQLSQRQTRLTVSH